MPFKLAVIQPIIRYINLFFRCWIGQNHCTVCPGCINVLTLRWWRGSPHYKKLIVYNDFMLTVYWRGITTSRQCGFWLDSLIGSIEIYVKSEMKRTDIVALDWIKRSVTGLYYAPNVSEKVWRDGFDGMVIRHPSYNKLFNFWMASKVRQFDSPKIRQKNVVSPRKVLSTWLKNLFSFSVYHQDVVSAPHTTSRLQHANGGITASFKLRYCTVNFNLSLYSFQNGRKGIYKIGHLTIMKYIQTVWNGISSSVIFNFWIAHSIIGWMESGVHMN